MQGQTSRPIKIFSLYRQFLDFLRKISSSPAGRTKKWPVYLEYYYRPHKEFLDAYFSHSPLADPAVLEERVEAVKAADYAGLKSLCDLSPPEPIIEEAFEKCLAVVSPPRKPEAYLFVGFFSPEGFVMDLRGRPILGFGLERFRDFRLLPVIFAHEYVHYLLRLANPEVPESQNIRWLIISEGLAAVFPAFVFPGLLPADYFLFRRDRLNWCQANEARLRDIYCSGRFSPQELLDFYERGNPGLDLPPRAAKYLGFRAVQRYLAQDPEASFSRLLLDKKLALSLEI